MNTPLTRIVGAPLLAAGLGLAGCLGPLASLSRAAELPMAETPPTYTTDGRLEFPAEFRDWIFLSAGLDMNYNEKPDMHGHSMFSNVFVNPESYREFKRTGTWPDRTLLVMDVRGAATKGSINKHGKYQSGDPMAIEVHVKDTKHSAGGWAFFAFNGTEPASAIPAAAPCYSCHEQHAALDTTFVQFYPTLLKVATEKRTLAPNYRP